MDLFSRIKAFEVSANSLFESYEDSGSSRVKGLERSYEKLLLLNLRQDDLFRQALRCVDEELFRAAHVMCWAAFMDYLQDVLENHGIAKLQAVYPAWQKTKNVSELAEYVPEAQLVESLHKLGICTKNQTKAFMGLLNKRNECAHPSNYLPGLNETLGYISEVLQRLSSLPRITA